MANRFTILKPLAVTPAMLISTNVTDEPIAAWAAGDFVLGQQCIHNRAIWECIRAAESINPPAVGDTIFIRVRSVNSWACLDRQKMSPTRRASSISYVFAPGNYYNAFAAVRVLNCNAVHVRLIDPVYGEIFSRSFNTGKVPVRSNWHAFLLQKWVGEEQSGVFIGDLPSFPTAHLHVDFIGTTGLSVGALMFGDATVWGKGINNGLTFDGVDWSKKDADEYGDAELVEGFFADTADFDVVLYRSEFLGMHRLLKSLRATPALYMMIDDMPDTMIYGKFNDFSLTHSNAKFAELSISLESMI